MKYALYPGCAAQGATPELYQSPRAIIGRLGIEVVELSAAACCGAGVVTEANPDLALAFNARTFAQAEALGLDVMTICGTCQGVMSAANRRLKTEPETLDRINAFLAPEGLALNANARSGFASVTTPAPQQAAATSSTTSIPNRPMIALVDWYSSGVAPCAAQPG